MRKSIFGGIQRTLGIDPLPDLPRWLRKSKLLKIFWQISSLFSQILSIFSKIIINIFRFPGRPDTMMTRFIVSTEFKTIFKRRSSQKTDFDYFSSNARSRGNMEIFEPPLHYSAQYAFCKVYFSAQPNKLRPILKFRKYYPVEHIFVPACSSARKIHFFKF